MKARNAWIVLPLAVLVLAMVLLAKGRSHEAPATARMQGDKQIIEVLAKSGYHPGEIIARAGVPIELKLKTDGTLDCSRAFTLPSLGIRKDLAISGESSIDIAAQPAGSTLRGVCSMGMDSFLIRFN